jgi:ABC-type thiamine transport system ATPase subunit
MIVDESFAALDPASRQTCLAVIAECVPTVVVIAHDELERDLN